MLSYSRGRQSHSHHPAGPAATAGRQGRTGVSIGLNSPLAEFKRKPEDKRVGCSGP